MRAAKTLILASTLLLQSQIALAQKFNHSPLYQGKYHG